MKLNLLTAFSDERNFLSFLSPAIICFLPFFVPFFGWKNIHQIWGKIPLDLAEIDEVKELLLHPPVVGAQGDGTR